MKEQILAVLVPVLGTILTAGITWAGAKLVSLINAKTKNEYLKGALVRAEQAVQTAVLEVKQTYVDAIKEASADGTLTPQEAAAARMKALDKAKSYLGTSGLAMLINVLGMDSSMLDSFIGGKIEAAVASGKPAAALAVPPVALPK